MKGLLVILWLIIIAILLGGCVATLQGNFDINAGYEKEGKISQMNQINNSSNKE